jgi:hypothetical protein
MYSTLSLFKDSSAPHRNRLLAGGQQSPWGKFNRAILQDA